MGGLEASVQPVGGVLRSSRKALTTLAVALSACMPSSITQPRPFSYDAASAWTGTVSPFASTALFKPIVFMQPLDLPELSRPSTPAVSVSWEMRLRSALPTIITAYAVENTEGHFRTPLRDTTTNIVYHLTAGECDGDLKTLLGRHWVPPRTVGRRGHRRHIEGHWAGSSAPKSNILVCRNGDIYLLTNPDRWANHAGHSVFDGRYDMSDYSVGVEFEARRQSARGPFVPLTDAQYAAGCTLTQLFKERYHLTDSAFVSHAQVAYRPTTNMRGRKQDGLGFEWERLCVDHRTDDPDVTAGRVRPEPHITYVHRLEAQDSLSASQREVRAYELYGPLSEELNTHRRHTRRRR
jgi:hypothetical protein